MIHLDAYEKTAYEYIQTNQPKFSHRMPGPRDKTEGSSNEPIDIDTDSEGEMGEMPRGSTSTFRASTPPQTQDSDSDSSTKDLGKTLKLVLRSELPTSKEITLTVRTTARCIAVLKAFIKKAGLDEEKYPELFVGESEGDDKGKGNKRGKKASGKDPRLCLDGDKFDHDTQIGQTDLDDGDMVDVVGL
jgi:hypothetical protein